MHFSPAYFEDWQIRTKDNQIIFGVTDFAQDKQKSDKVLVLVHGLTGHMNEYHIKGAANFFCKQGYDVVRFNLYPGGEGRKLRDTTLQTYAADLNLVLEEKTAGAGYDKVFVAGHSYGGPTIMIAQPKRVTALSLWDPSFNLSGRFKAGKFITEKKTEFNIWDRGVETLLGDAFIEEYRDRYDTEECLALSKALSDVPIQVVAADECNGQDAQSWHSAGHALNERHIIQDADHCFWRGNVFDQVLSLSHQWFERF